MKKQTNLGTCMQATQSALPRLHNIDGIVERCGQAPPFPSTFSVRTSLQQQCLDLCVAILGGNMQRRV